MVTARRAFTAIELAVVVAIALMLMAMTLPALARLLAENRVHSAAFAILGAGQQARRLAMEHTPSDQLYGVELSPSANGAASITLLRGATPIGTLIQLPPDIVIYGGAVALPSPVRWWYRYGSGMPVSANDPAALSPAVIGFTPLQAGLGDASGATLVESAGEVTLVAPWGLPGYRVSMAVVAPSSAGLPGMWLRGRSDAQLRVAVSIYSGGLGHAARF